jgi:hypothetical protein
MFPTDPNAPGGPDRSESVRRDHARGGRLRRGLRLLSLSEPRKLPPAGWPPVRQLTPLGTAQPGESGRSAA